MTLVVVLLVAYLLGSVPTSYLVVYRLTGRDIRSIGNGNPGTMNVLDNVGARAAILVGVGDIAKGMGAVGVAYLAGLDDSAAVLAALFAVAGHDWSIFMRLDGGNGTAAAVGGLVALLPLAAAVASGIAVLVYLVTRSRRLGGIAGLLMVPALAYGFQAPDVKVAGALLLLTVTALKIIRSEGFSPAHHSRR